VPIDILKHKDSEADETKSGPMIRDTIRLSVIRYGDYAEENKMPKFLHP
jgi:hypothetical protein